MDCPKILDRLKINYIKSELYFFYFSKLKLLSKFYDKR